MLNKMQIQIFLISFTSLVFINFYLNHNNNNNETIVLIAVSGIIKNFVILCIN